MLGFIPWWFRRIVAAALVAFCVGYVLVHTNSPEAGFCVVVAFGCGALSAESKRPQEKR